MRLHIFDGPFVTTSTQRYELATWCRRLVVWLALTRCPVDRRLAAGTIWPATDGRRAAGNLRSALWRLREAGLELISSQGSSIALNAAVTVDMHEANTWALRMITGAAGQDDIVIVPWFSDALRILPGWPDPWATIERERLRQRVLHAFEELSRRLSIVGRHDEALRAARMLGAAEPLRESAQRVLADVYLSAGQSAEAERAWRSFVARHADRFGVDTHREVLAIDRGHRQTHIAAKAASKDCPIWRSRCNS